MAYRDYRQLSSAECAISVPVMPPLAAAAAAPLLAAFDYAGVPVFAASGALAAAGAKQTIVTFVFLPR